MVLSQDDLRKIDALIEKRVAPLNILVTKNGERLSNLEIQAKTTGRRLDEISDKFDGVHERLDNLTDRFDELSDRTDKLQDDVTYVKQKQRQDHLEVMVKLDELKTQETEDIEAAYSDIERLKKRVRSKS
jgi:septation ring formation regulator EzrA